MAYGKTEKNNPLTSLNMMELYGSKSMAIVSIRPFLFQWNECMEMILHIHVKIRSWAIMDVSLKSIHMYIFPSHLHMSKKTYSYMCIMKAKTCEILLHLVSFTWFSHPKKIHAVVTNKKSIFNSKISKKSCRRFKNRLGIP